MFNALRPHRDADGYLVVNISQRHKGKWCWVSISGLPQSNSALASLSVESDNLNPITVMLYAHAAPWGLLKGSLFALTYIGSHVECIRIYASAGQLSYGSTMISVRDVPRWLAAVILVFSSPKKFISGIRESFKGSVRGIWPRSRKKLALLANPAPQDMPYELWLALFDNWSDVHRKQLFSSPLRACWPKIDIALYHSEGDDEAAQATLDGLNRQWYPAASVTHKFSRAAPPGAALFGPDSGAGFVGILQAGEVLPAHALAVLADQAVRGNAAILYADEDRIDAAQRRAAPHFKPELGPTLLLSGCLTRGIWLFRA